MPLARSTLRSWQEADVGSLDLHGNDPGVWLNLTDRFPHPYTEADAMEWIRATRSDGPETNFAIAVDGVAAGGIGFHINSDVYRRSAQVGYWLGRPHWGKGIVTEALREI